MVIYAQAENLTLSPAPVSIPLGRQLKGPIYANVANNTLSGVSSGGPNVQIRFNGAEPGWIVQYASTLNPSSGNVSWVEISGSGANVSYIISDDLEPITVSIYGQVTTGGGTTVNAGNITLGDIAEVSVYTVPSNYRAYIVRLACQNGDPSNSHTFYSNGGQQSGASPLTLDWYTDKTGLSVSATRTAYISSGPGNDIQLTNPNPLLPGDRLFAWCDTTQFVTFSYNLLLEPL